MLVTDSPYFKLHSVCSWLKTYIALLNTVALEKHTTQFANNSTDVPEKTEARNLKSRARGHKKQNEAS